MCKDFLWGIAEGQRRMVFKSWGSLCKPRKEGGVDIKEILSWNKAQMMNWLYKLETNTPNVWVQWVNAYILKGVSFWDFQVTAAHSWFWGNIIICRDSLLALTGGVSQAKELLSLSDYKLQVYEGLREKGPTLSVYKTLSDTFNYPKHVIIGLLAIQNKLPTVDNLCRRGMMLVNRCVLCESHSETASHLFFDCAYSATVLQTVSQWLQIPPKTHLLQVLHWFKGHNRGKSWLKRQRRCLLLSTLYLLWNERNKRIFKDLAAPPSVLIRKVQYLVLTRLQALASDDSFY
ncbi:uncharacterized protein LOC141596657 [Silene latifolia]|uniref:uncharacterized protein LOC141596657 n=1 Tax=Silene latifolia TaxID=37657 RepID=UPI003D771A17